MYRFLIMVATIASLFISACCTGKKGQPPAIPATGKTAAPAEADIPFQAASRYFLRNDADLNQLTDPRVFNREKFDLLFGAAAVMGKDGQPTAIDFTSHYVIALVSEPVNRLNEFQVLSLKSEGGKMVLRYRVQEGRELSSTIQPLLLLIVNRSHQAELVLKKE